MGMINSDNFRKARLAKNLSQPALARIAGVSQSLIDQIESGTNKTSRHIFALARALDVDVGHLDPEIDEGIPLPRRALTSAPPIQPAGRPDLPVFGAAEGGRGSMVISWEPIEYLQRIDPLVTVRSAYGMRVVGDSMEPAYFQGDTVFINPNIPARPMTDVILFKESSDNETEAMLKHLLRFSSSEWFVSQYNPKREFTLSRKEWQSCQIIVAKYNR